MNKSSPFSDKRKVLLGQVTAGAMALIGFGMFLGAFLQGEPLTGTAFNLAWVLLSVGFSLAVVWSVLYLLLARKR
jgi:hypothetical protein